MPSQYPSSRTHISNKLGAAERSNASNKRSDQAANISSIKSQIFISPSYLHTLSPSLVPTPFSHSIFSL
jgi:hypothetical protein